MPEIITLAGSPNPHSRSSRLLSHAEGLLTQAGVSYQRFSLSDFPAEDLIHARLQSPATQDLNSAIAGAKGLLIASPVYQGSFSAGLKALLDQIQHRGLRGKAVHSIATSGSIAHRNSLELALIPVLKTLEARHIHPGINVADQEFPVTGAISDSPIPDDVCLRLQESLQAFIEQLGLEQTALEIAA